MIVRKKTLTVRPPVLVSLYEVVHLSVCPLELSHSHGVQVVQDQTQAVLRQLEDVGVLVSRGLLVWSWGISQRYRGYNDLTSGFDGETSTSIAVLQSSCCFTLILFIIFSLLSPRLPVTN